MLKNSDIKKSIIEIFLEMDDTCEINSDTNFFDEGVLDSTRILYLVAELESIYNITIPLEDIIEDNFKNLHAVEGYLLKRIIL